MQGAEHFQESAKLWVTAGTKRLVKMLSAKTGAPSDLCHSLSTRYYTKLAWATYSASPVLKASLR